MPSDHSTFPTSVTMNPRRLRLPGLIVLFIFGAIIVSGAAFRIVSAKNLRKWTEAQSVPTVEVVSPVVSSETVPLELSGTLDAFINAPIYARTGGYLKSWSKDIGAEVKAGDVLGVIDAPDLDQELQKAEADLASARANAQLAELTAKRWQDLQATEPDSVAMQAVDERNSAYAAQRAFVDAAQANLARLKVLVTFESLVAPFDGRITVRNTDVGQLVSSGQVGAPLFVISDTRKLRVYVRVPQVYANSIHIEDKATLRVPEHPNESFEARVVADARAIHPGSGTTLVQLQVDNRDGRLLPSSYASLRFELPANTLGLQVPAEALIFDDKGLRVATLDASDCVLFKRVTIRRDYGKTLELGGDLVSGDRVILNPLDGLSDGDKVQVATQVQVGSHEKT